MFGFEYTYMSSFEVLEQIKGVREYSLMEFWIIIVGILFIIALVFFVVPYIDIYLRTRKQEAEKKKKKALMDRIVLQKNLEDVITRELKERSDLLDK